MINFFDVMKYSLSDTETALEESKSVWTILKDSIPDNIYIFFAALLCFIAFVFSVVFATVIRKHFEKATGEGLKSANYYILDISYSLFVTIISIFPLLGMFGTVVSLIDLGSLFQATSDMTEIKSDFFLALTSTAWGIIFSVIFKFFFNAPIQTWIENQLEKAKENLKI